MEYGWNQLARREGTKLHSIMGTKFKKTCMQHTLHLLDAPPFRVMETIYVVWSTSHDLPEDGR